MKPLQNIKLTVIDSFGDLNSFANEIPFIDDGLIVSMIDSLKSDYKQNADRLKDLERFDDDNEYRQQKSELYNSQMQIRSELAYLFSHNPEKIDDALGLMEHSKNSFAICLQAMKHYTQGNNDQSMDAFLHYMNTVNSVPNHYLACKMLGSLLMDKSEFQYAIHILRVASEKRPEDIEVHEKLMECYRAEGMTFELDIASSAVQLLTSTNLGSFAPEDVSPLGIQTTGKGWS